MSLGSVRGREFQGAALASRVRVPERKRLRGGVAWRLLAVGRLAIRRIGHDSASPAVDDAVARRRRVELAVGQTDAKVAAVGQRREATTGGVTGVHAERVVADGAAALRAATSLGQ